MRKIVYRADGGPILGMGHLVRGMSLAEAIAGDDTEFVFVTQDIHRMPDLLMSKGHTVWTVEPEVEPSSIARVIASMEPGVVVNDIQNAPIEYVESLKTHGIPVISFDDTGEAASLADVLIDANISDETLYLTNGGPLRRYGPEYMLLNRSFADIHERQRVIRESVNDVLIIMGGADPNNFTERIILALDSLAPSFMVTAVAGYGFTKREILAEMAERRDWLNVISSPESVGEIMAIADIAFSSGGISMFELSAVGTPNIVICQTPQEVRNAEIFVEKGIIESLGMGEYLAADEISTCFRQIADSIEKRETMSSLGKGFIDGKGIERITGIIEKCMMQFSS